MERGVISFDQGTLAVFVRCMEPGSGSQLTCRGVIRCLPPRRGKCTIGRRRRRGSIIKRFVGSTEAWQSTSEREKCSTHELLISVAAWTDLPFRWREEKCDGKKTKQNTDSLFLWFICWFIPRCEYDSMFVQDDVILNVDIFFFKGIHTGQQHALLLLLATNRPLCLAVDHVIVWTNKKWGN